MAQRIRIYPHGLWLLLLLGLLAHPAYAGRKTPPPPTPQPRSVTLLEAGWGAVLEKGGAPSTEWAKKLPETQPLALPFNWECASLTKGATGALWCAREITLPANAGAQLVIENAVGILDVYLDGTPVAHVLGNGLPRRIRLTGDPGSTHYLALRLDRAGLPEAIRLHAHAGMGPISLEALPAAAIDVLTTETNPGKKSLTVHYRLASTLPGSAKLQIELLPLSSSRPLVTETATVDLTRGTVEGERSLSIKKLARWSPATPALYRLRVTLLGPGRSSDLRELTYGVCDFTYDRRAFMLDGQPILLKGLRLPGGVPLLSKPTMAQTLEEELALVKKAGFNAIMANGAALPEEALAIADRIGLLVICDIPLGRVESANAAPFRREVAAAVENFGAHPCLAAWSWSGTEAGADDPARLRALDPRRLLLLRDSDPSRIINGSAGDAFINLDTLPLSAPVPATWPGWEVLRQAKTGNLPILLSGIGIRPTANVAGARDALPACLAELREIIERLRTSAYPLGYFLHPLPGSTLTGLSGDSDCLSQAFTAALSFNSPCMVAARVKPGARPGDAPQLEAAIINDQGIKGNYELYQLLTGPDGATKITRKGFNLSGDRLQDVTRLIYLPDDKPGDYALNLMLSKQAVVIAGDQLSLTIPPGREKR